MTERDLYDAALIEINKLEAPSMLLEDYNYFINKAIQQYINKAYNRYEINQQATDDLRALKTSVTLYVNAYKNTGLPNEVNYYFSVLPNDYLHMLNCVVKFDVGENSSNECKKDTFSMRNAYVARKLTSDIYPTIINNAYFKPSYKTPYYTISTISETAVDIENILDPCNEVISGPGDIIHNILEPCGDDNPWKGGFVINIRCGDNPRYTPSNIYVDYIKTPKKINLTEEKLEYVYIEGDLENEKNRPEEMEFPDYVCYEIINEFVKLLLENTSDPRLQTNVPINQTILPQASE